MAESNPYGHLSLEDLTVLRYEKQHRYEQLFDVYHEAYLDWAFVMNAIRDVTEANRVGTY